MADHNEQRLRRKRARQACTACNARRVKCNVTDRQPCDNCIAGNVSCETRESRRGKHPRRHRTSTIDQQLLPAADGSQTSESPVHSTLLRHEDELAASHVLASLSTNLSVEQTLVPGADQRPAHALSANNEQEEDGAVYLGESSSLRYVPDEQAPALPFPKRSKLRHPIPNAAKAQAMIPQWEAERRKARIKLLQSEGAFTFPEVSIQEDLLKAYFRWFHPHFAIVDEPEIWKAHADGSLSPLLLQAMLFIGVIHCENKTLESLGWGNRHRAKYMFYCRAKDIYDADFETKKISIIQALFLMSCWRARALEEKDVRFWLGTAINLAQTKALHRSSAQTSSFAGLKKRIWWCIYIRERQASAALGLPSRIREDDCDVGLLTHGDFDSAFTPSVSASDRSRIATYAIEMMQLARTLGRIVDTGYLPNRSLSSSDRANIREGLYKWKQQLPSLMQSSDGDPANFQASMLHLAYNNLLILLHRSSFVANDSESGDSDGNIALQAAARNSRIVEDMLADGTMGHAQIHVITNLFNTLCIHVAHLRQSTGINRTIAEHRAKLCLLGLQELQRTWELTNWVLQLFFQYLDRSTAARLETQADDAEGSGGTSQSVGAGSLAPAQGTALSSSKQDIPESSVMTTTLNDPAMSRSELEPSMTPWSWTTDEANQYLFTQMENEFSFGEGGMLSWSPTEMQSSDGNILEDLWQWRSLT